MMRTTVFKPALLCWQLRQLLVFNALALVVASLYVLLHTRPMVAVQEAQLLVVLLHSSAVVWKLGRVSARRTGFLYTVGFTRDQIGYQAFLASAISGMSVCVTAWLLMVTGLRSAVQDRWYENMYFPFMAPEEYFVPWVWLFAYAIVLPPLHYVWIRANQPCRGGTSGWMLLLLALFFYAWSFDRGKIYVSEMRFLYCVAALHIPVTVLLVIGCWRLHRTMEIRS